MGTRTSGETAGEGRTAGGRDASDGDPTGDDDFRYSVHDWGGDVDRADESRSLDHTTAVGVGCIALCYPLFVYASLAPAFPLPVNAVVAACTLVLVGYLLTMPRVALATFGAWSVLAPAALRWLPIEPFPILGLLAIAAVWVPLGYAVAIGWALRA